MGNDNDEFDGYVYVKAEIIKAAVYGDEDTFNMIFDRYEQEIVRQIVARIRQYDMVKGYFPINDLKHTVWIGMREAVRKYRPR